MNAGRREKIRKLIQQAKGPDTDGVRWGELLDALEECFEELDTLDKGCIDCGFERCCLACRSEPVIK